MSDTITLRQAAIDLLAEIDRQHDTKPSPLKYAIPYGKVNALRAALDAPAAPQAEYITAENIAQARADMTAQAAQIPVAAEQQARDVLDRMGVPDAQSYQGD